VSGLGQCIIALDVIALDVTALDTTALDDAVLIGAGRRSATPLVLFAVGHAPASRPIPSISIGSSPGEPT